jgi:hypothetical protein
VAARKEIPVTDRLEHASVKAALLSSLIASVLLLPQVGVTRVAAIPDFETPAAQLRLSLDSALAEHAFLLAEAMRTGLAAGADFAAAGRALEANSVSVIGLIEQVYGSDAASAFGGLWRQHIAYLIDYTRALANDDADAQALAEHQLHTYVADFSALLASANPNLPRDVVDNLVSEHVEQLETVASFKTADYARAYPGVRATYKHMFTLGDALARAIAMQFPEKFLGVSIAFGPAANLRLNLDQLLGEHTLLAAIAMRAGASNASDKAAAAAALGANSDEIEAAISGIYGAAAGDAFAALWKRHTDAYLAYVAAVLSQDQTGREQAIKALGDYQTDFTNFLTDANPKLSSSGLTELLRHHTQQLIDQADAFAAKDYDAAYDVVHEANAHAISMADALALAIAAQFPVRYPDTAVRATSGWSGAMQALGVGILVLLAIGLWRGRRRRVPNG